VAVAPLPSKPTFCKYPVDMLSGFLFISPANSVELFMHYSKPDQWTVLESPLKTAFSMKLAIAKLTGSC
jgi:hypothetical protein